MRNPPILFPDVEDVLVAYLPGPLSAHLDKEVTVATKIPDERPVPCVRPLRTGGPRRDLVTDQAQITFECWAETETEAQRLAQLTRALVHALQGTVVVPDELVVYLVEEFSGPQNLPDPLTAVPRYSFTLLLHVRGHELVEELGS